MVPELEIHALARLFPEMSREEYTAFRDDIAAGIRPTPTIWTYKGQIVDGRHGYRASRELGRMPDIREWHGEGSLLAFVIAVNLNRRQLTSAQRACVAVEIEALLAVEAATRQRRGKAADPAQNNGEGVDLDRHAGEAAEQAARATGTNRDYVAKAKKIKRHWPELFEKVRSGVPELPEANRLLREAMQALKEDSVELHERVIRGEKTIPQAQRMARRLPPKVAPAPPDAGVQAETSASDMHGDGGRAGGDGDTATAENAENLPDTGQSVVASAPVDRIAVLAQGYEEGFIEIDATTGMARIAADVLSQVSAPDQQRPIRLFNGWSACVRESLSQGIICVIIPRLALGCRP